MSSGYDISKKLEKEGNYKSEGGCSSSSAEVRIKSWRILWKLLVKQKLNYNTLPINALLYNRFKKGCSVCYLCGKADETVEHSLPLCRKIPEVWKLAPITMTCFIWSSMELLETVGKDYKGALSRTEDSRLINLTINLLWRIWKARNKLIFQGNGAMDDRLEWGTIIDS